MKTGSIKRKINRRNKTTIKKGDLLFYCCLLAIPLIQIAIFYFGVNFQSFLLAFQKKSGGTFVFDISSNLKRFSNDISKTGFWKMVGNSFIVYLCTSLTGTVLATIFSYYIYKRRTFANFFKFVLFLPSILPALLLVIMFRMFASQAFPAYFEILFKQPMPNYLDIRYSGTQIRFVIITIYTIWISFGSQVLVYTGAMDQIPTEVIEAGKIDGTNSFTEFIHIILPYILATVGTFLIAGVASIFTNQNNLFSFFRWDQVNQNETTIGYYLYTLVYSDNSKGGYCYAAFLGLMCTVIVIPLSFAVRKTIERLTK